LPLEAIQEWLDLRFRLYNVFMTNPLDFSAKAMLIEAIRLGLKGTDTVAATLDESNWSFTDSALLAVLREYHPSASLVRRFETGDLFEMAGLFWVDGNQCTHPLNDLPKVCLELRKQASEQMRCSFSDVLFYGIKDKRSRKIERDRITGISIDCDLTASGALDNHVLLGCVCAKISDASVLRKSLAKLIGDYVGGTSITLCDPVAHMDQAFTNTTGFLF
jgi:hypothetical protein